MTARTALLAAMVPLALTPVPTVVRAQGAPPVGVTCLTRSFLDASDNPHPLTIYVPAGEAGTYAALGYVAGACGAMTINAYRDEACRVAHLGNDAVQNRLTQVLGARPKDLCASVLRVAPFPVDAGS